MHESDASSSGFISLSTTSSRALESLTNLNAYITSETFNIPSVSSFRLQSAQNANSRALGPAEEEVRRELRALKGLVLNRCVINHCFLGQETNTDQTHLDDRLYPPRCETIHKLDRICSTYCPMSNICRRARARDEIFTRGTSEYCGGNYPSAGLWTGSSAQLNTS